MVLLFFGLVLSMLALGEVARISIIPGVNATPLDFLVGIAMVVWAGKRIITRKPVVAHFILPISAFLLACIISLLCNFRILPLPQFLIAALYLLRWTAYASIYPMIAQTNQKTKKWLTSMLIATGLLLAVLGFIQYLLYTNLINLSYLGWDEHWYRLFSTFFDPNFAGVFFVLNLLLIFNFLILSFSKKKYTQCAGFAGIALIFLTAIFLTFSRSALLGLFAGITTYFFLYKKSRIIAITGFVLFIIGVSIILSNYKATEGTKLFRVISSKERLDGMGSTISIFAKNPLVGVGFDAYRYAQYRYGIAHDTNWQVSNSGAGSDNSFLFILATTGILGLLSYGYMLFRIMQDGVKNIHRSFSLVIVSSFIASIVASFFINALFYPSIMLWLWMMIGVTENNVQ